MLDRFFTRFTGGVSDLAGRPVSFITMLALTLLWGVTGPYFHFSDTWQLVINTSTTIITCLLGFLLLNANNRSEIAIQTKLDELLAANDKTHKKVIGVEHLTLKELEGIRKHIEETVSAA